MPRSFRTPRGTAVRNTPDWYGSTAQGFHIVQNGAAGQNSYVGVYNANPTSAFYVFGLDISVGSGSYVFFEVIPGNPGSTYTDGSPTGPIDPRTPQLGLTPIAFTEPTCIGLHVGGAGALAGQIAHLYPAFPLIIAPTSYSALLQVRNQNVTIEATIYGCLVPQG